jgi:hypothetical protein
MGFFYDDMVNVCMHVYHHNHTDTLLHTATNETFKKGYLCIFFTLLLLLRWGVKKFCTTFQNKRLLKVKVVYLSPYTLTAMQVRIFTKKVFFYKSFRHRVVIINFYFHLMIA